MSRFIFPYSRVERKQLFILNLAPRLGIAIECEQQKRRRGQQRQDNSHGTYAEKHRAEHGHEGIEYPPVLNGGGFFNMFVIARNYVG